MELQRLLVWEGEVQLGHWLEGSTRKRGEVHTDAGQTEFANYIEHFFFTYSEHRMSEFSIISKEMLVTVEHS